MADASNTQNPSQRKPLTAERLRELLHYDPETGVFTWLVARRGPAVAGAAAGSVTPQGYRQISIDDRQHRANRLAWLYVKGEWPAGEIDHRNLNRGDNRWSNLRLATGAQNRTNRPIQRNNRAGLKGVYRGRGGRFCAQITASGEQTHLGTFDTAEAAHAAYVAASRRLHGEFGRTG